MTLQRLALMGGAFLLAGPATAENVMRPPVISVDYGIVCDYVPQGQLTEAPGTNAGRVRRGGVPFSFDIRTNLVPAKPNLAFGILVETAEDAGQLDVVMVTHHPAFGPGYLEQESWPSTLTGGVPNGRYFFFEFDYERVPGDWALEILLDGEVIVRQEFTVLPLSQSAEILRACPAPQMMS